jgi:hypothetical protein
MRIAEAAAALPDDRFRWAEWQTAESQSIEEREAGGGRTSTAGGGGPADRGRKGRQVILHPPVNQTFRSRD